MNTTVLLSVGVPIVYAIGGLVVARLSYSYDMSDQVTNTHHDSVRAKSESAGWSSVMAFMIWPILAVCFIVYYPVQFIGLGINRFVTGGFKKKRARYLEGKSPTVSRSS